MNKTELINAVAEKAGLSKVDAKKAVEAAVAAVTEALAKGAIETAVETAVPGLSVTNVTIVGGSLNTNDRVQVTVTGTADGQNVTATAFVTVQ